MPCRKRAPGQGGDPTLHHKRRPSPSGLKLTRSGALYITTTLLLGFAAVNTGNNLLYLLVSMLLAFMATSGVLGWLNIRGLDCRITFPDEIYSDSPTLVTALVVNLKRQIPSYLLQVRILDELCSITSASERKPAAFSFAHTFRGRGYHECGYAIISSPFPVNFFVRGVKIPLEGRAVAFPAPLSLKIGDPSHSIVENGMAARKERGFDGDIAAISDYSGAEPLKMIHWRLSARHDWFKVKEPAASSAEPVVIDLTTPSTIPLEERLSRATYIVNRLCRENRPVGLKLTADRLIPATTGRNHRLKLLTELAMYDPSR